MKICKKGLILFLVLSISPFAFAKNIVFSCVQNQLAPENAGKITFQVEDYIFASLFDAGLIASNVPFTTNDAGASENAANVAAALENKSEYILVVKLEYAEKPFTDTKTNEMIAKLDNLKYSLYSGENTFIYEQSINIAGAKTKAAMLKNIEAGNRKVMKKIVQKVD